MSAAAGGGPVQAGLPRVAASSRQWRDRAACRDAELAVFFPGPGESAEPAQQVCAECEVRQPCLDYALGNVIRHGVWGGLTERDRRAMRTRHLRARREERDRAVLAAHAAGHSAEAIGRALGLSRSSVSRVLARAVNGAVRP